MSDRKHRLLYWCGLAVILLLSTAVVMLMVKNNELRSRLRENPITIVRELRSGDRIEPIEALTIEGLATTVTFSEPGMKYLVLVFSTTCPYCDNNLEKWRSFARSCSQVGCSVIGISIHPIGLTRQYLLDRGVPFYAVVNTDRKFTEENKLPGVPMTILISNGGLVENVWSGALDDDQVGEISQSMHLGARRSNN